MSGAGRPLLSRSFFLLAGLSLLAQVSSAAFFHFHEHLLGLGLDERAAGAVIGVFSLAVLAVRLPASPLLHAGNARAALAWSVLATGGALLLYGSATSFPALVLLRVVHGAAYAVVLTAVTARFVVAIPEGRSAEAFGWMSVILLVPYALVPPLFTLLEQASGGFAPALAHLGWLTFAGLPLAALLPPAPTSGPGRPRITAAELIEDLRSGPVRLGLLLSLAVWTGYGAVFAFLDSFGRAAGIAHPGLFLTVSTAAEASVRAAGSRLLDRLDKRRTLAVALAFLAAGYALLPSVRSQGPFLGLAVALGLAWGVAMPLLSGFLFDVSPPPLRALNTNLGMAAFQAGFFVGPAAGGPLIEAGGHGALFLGCAALSAGGAAAAAAAARGRPPLSSPG